jgi:hypothetical protein
MKRICRAFTVVFFQAVLCCRPSPGEWGHEPEGHYLRVSLFRRGGVQGTDEPLGAGEGIPLGGSRVWHPSDFFQYDHFVY